MFGNLMGDMEAKKAAMQQKLDQIVIEEQAGAITIKVNANRKILNIGIDQSKLDSDDIEELEDLLLISINRALDKASEEEASQSQEMINSIMPPGLGNLFGGM